MFDVLAQLDKGYGEYSYIRSLEIDLLRELRMTIEEYGQIPVMERAIMIAGRQAPKWVEAIETDRQIKEAKRKQHGNV